MPPPFGTQKIYVSTEGGLRYGGPLGRVDPTLLNAASQLVHPGMRVWDIGANLGLFAVAAGARVGRSGSVVAVEPDPWLARILQRTTALNGTGVRVIQAAVASSPGPREFVIANRSRSTNYLLGYGTTQTGGVRSTLSVATTTLDLLADECGLPDLIKIDVEGAEAEVLAGAAHVLASRPTLIIEVADENADVIGDTLRTFGYVFTDLDTNEPVQRPTPNTLARVAEPERNETPDLGAVP